MKKTEKFDSEAQGLGYLFPQDFSRLFVKLQEDDDELRQVNPRQASVKRSGIVSLFSA